MIPKIVYSLALAVTEDEPWSQQKAQQFWFAAGSYSNPHVLVVPESLSVDAWEGVHDLDYVRGVYRGLVRNGFELRSHVDDRLGTTRPALAAAACFVEAARLAREHKTGICAPVSGFHHAKYDSAGGYCTFNALMLAAKQAVDDGAKRVLIYDGDAHFGDGCVDILRRMQHRDKKYVYITYVGRDAGIPDNQEQKALTNAGYMTYQPWDLVLYQAGADAWKRDALGSGYMSAYALTMRDKLIFRSCAEHKSPLVWCLAGGYNGEDTMKLHRATWDSFLEAYSSNVTIDQLRYAPPAGAEE